MTTAMQQAMGKAMATALILFALLAALAPKAHAFGPAGSGAGGVQVLTNNALSHLAHAESAKAEKAEAAKAPEGASLAEAIARFFRGAAPTAASLEPGVPLS